MLSRIRNALALAAGLALALLVPDLAVGQSSAWVTIDDAGLTRPAFPDILLASLNDSGYTTPTAPGSLGGAFARQAGAVISLVNEVPGPFGTLGKVIMHFEYNDPTPIPTSGSPRIADFNFSPGEGGPGTASDTLQLTFTRLTSGSNNTSVDLTFFSDHETTYPTALGAPPNGLLFNITETGQYQDLTADIASATGLSNFHTRAASDVVEGGVVPEPAGLVLLGTGAVGLLGCVAWRRRVGLQSSIGRPAE